MNMLKRSLNTALLITSLLLLIGTVTAQDNPNARVKDMSSTLRLRQAPSVTGGVIMELAGGTPLKLVGRTANNSWLKVETYESQTGWVSAAYVVVYIALADVPVLNEAPVTSMSPVATVSSDEGGARVASMNSTLRLRQEPSTAAAILAELSGGTPLQIIGRTEDSAWLNVTTASGLTGWVSAAYVVSGGTPAAVVAPSGSGAGSLPSASGVRGVRDIYARGQTLGNRRGVFTKIGDSITVSEYALDAIGRNTFNLGGYGNLQRVIDTFLSTGFNSFTHVSSAAGVGWTTSVALEPRCNGISAVECELDGIKPSVALIQLGTNDLLYLSPDQFSYNLARIVDICIDRGVVPVLATIPYRDGFEDGVNTFNAIIRGIASSRDIPIWDVKGALDGLPNRGLSGDGVHPSWPPAGYADSANFANPEALQAGYVARNLKALQVLEYVLNAVGG